MIYVCEYDGSAEKQLLQQYAAQLPLPSGKNGTKEWLWEKQRQRILAWLLLEYALEQKDKKCTVRVTQLEIARTEYGKPYSSAYPELQFNLSHCETACACVVSREKVGIDVEKRFAYKENLWKKVCHVNESGLFRYMTEQEREQQLRFLWSMKESYVKLDGRGLGYGMNRIDLSELLPVMTLDMASEEKSVDKRAQADWKSALQLSVPMQLDGCIYLVGESERYTLSVCRIGESQDGQVTVIKEQDIVTWLLEKNA